MIAPARDATIYSVAHDAARPFLSHKDTIALVPKPSLQESFAGETKMLQSFQCPGGAFGKRRPEKGQVHEELTMP